MALKNMEIGIVYRLINFYWVLRSSASWQFYCPPFHPGRYRRLLRKRPWWLPSNFSNFRATTKVFRIYSAVMPAISSPLADSASMPTTP